MSLNNFIFFIQADIKSKEGETDLQIQISNFTSFLVDLNIR